MGPWISTRRVRLTAIVIILLAGAAAGSLLDAVAARLATFLIALAIAIAPVTLGASRPRGARRSAGEKRELAAERRDRMANTRDEAAEHRDADAVQRNHDADQRDHDAGEFARRRAQSRTEAGWNGHHPALARHDDLHDPAARTWARPLLRIDRARRVRSRSRCLAG